MKINALFYTNPNTQHPTLGGTPHNSEWFHCTRIYIILDEGLKNLRMLDVNSQKCIDRPKS